MNFNQVISNINNKDDFMNFMDLLVLNLKNNPEEWTNQNLLDYLQAITSWVEDMEGYYINNNLPYPEKITWRAFADVLIAAKIYE